MKLTHCQKRKLFRKIFRKHSAENYTFPGIFDEETPTLVPIDGETALMPISIS